MSVEYIKRLAGPYVGDGTGQKTFSFGFLIFDKSDVYVAVAASSDSDPSDLQQGTDYTVSMNADQSATPGGTITLTSESGLAKDSVLVIGSAVDYTQTLDLTNYTRFPPERITTELDRIVVMIQQIVELLGRVVQVPPTSSISPADLFFQLLNAAESAAQSAEDAAASLAACERIRQLIEQYSWDIPHVVESLRDVENYPYDGLFAVAGYGNAGGNGQNISNRYVKAEGSTELRTLGERFADVVNVRDFGAVGDGVTDDTEAIEAALAAGAGKTVFFPRGNYIVNGETNFSIQANTAILGAGWQTTAITTVNETGQLPYLFLVTGDNVSIEGLSFDGGRPETEKDQLLGRQGLVEYNGVYGYSGLTVNKCYIHDFCSRTIYTLANNTTVTHNRIERCSLFNADLSSMRGVVTNWYSPSADAKQMSNVIVENNHFIDCGHFAAGWLKCASVKESGNLVEYASAIGFGHQWCEDVAVTDNTFRYTYMNGVDLQECVRQVISGNTFFMSGYMRMGASGATDLCQALFVGSDYARQDSRDAVISNNVIEGAWTEELFDAEEPESFYMTGTGIVLNSTTNAAITGNVIRGMGRPYSAERVSSEDGMGMHITNTCENVVISGNTVESCKGCGVLLGPANVRNATLIGNSIRGVGEDGIHVSSVSVCSGVSVLGNTITELKNVYGKDICAGVFIGSGQANLSQIRVNDNAIFSKDNELSSSGTKFFTHGVYFGFDNVIAGPTYCGLSTFEINGNFINGYSVAPIGFDSRCYTSSSSRHFRSIANNRCGGISGTSGLITDVQNRNWAMEFVGESQPTSGSYVIGDRVWRAYPAENPIGWVCIATGSPGTWRELNYVVPTA